MKNSIVKTEEDSYKRFPHSQLFSIISITF